MIKQISVFVENKLGRLAEVTKVLADANVNLCAFSIAETTDFGILRMIVDKRHEAEQALRHYSLAFNTTEVLGLTLPDKPGSFANAVRILSDHGIAIEYMYAFHTACNERAVIILRVNDNEKAVAVLERHGIKLIDENEV